MPIDFYVDPRGLPAGFDKAKQDAFVAGVESQLEGSFGLPKAGNELVHAAITGMLLLDEHFAPDAFGFGDGIQKAWKETLGKTRSLPDATGNRRDVPNREIYDKVAQIIDRVNGRSRKISYQQFASVSRYVTAGADELPIDHEDFPSQVRIGLDRYVAGTPAFDSLSLPPLTGDAGSDVEIVEDNIRAVAAIYAAYQLERMGVVRVVDRISELAINGLLPFTAGAEGRALDKWQWEAEDRPNEAARYTVFGRVLGVAGADVSKEVVPNKAFEPTLLRFVSGFVEHERQFLVANIVDSRRRALTFNGEQVRRSGFDCAGNASLYGWGGTHFAARRGNALIAEALDILKLPQVQKAFGVSNPWQVVERVSASEFGQSPNIVKYRTLAESGKAILDLVAKHSKVWSANTGRPLFDEQVPDPANSARVVTIRGDIPPSDEAELLRHAQAWLAVSGIGDEQVEKLSQPVDMGYAPSVPTFGALAPGSGNGAAKESLEKLQQMVASGATPTLDQLKQLLPAFQ